MLPFQEEYKSKIKTRILVVSPGFPSNTYLKPNSFLLLMVT